MNPNVLPPPLPPPAVFQPIMLPAEQWKKKYPSIISGILAFLQFGITFVIIGCEVGSVLIDMVTATIYVGFWSGIFFIFAWLSVAGSGMISFLQKLMIFFLFYFKLVAVVVVDAQSIHLSFSVLRYFSRSVLLDSMPII